jgi:hypothetical protein
MSWLDLDRATWKQHLGRAVFRFRHRLAGHPALTREALADVAERHPLTRVEHHLADLPVLLPSGVAPQLPAAPGRVVRELDANRCWVALFDLQVHPGHRELLDEATLDLPPLPRREGRLGATASHAFCASPSSTVPVHFDRHHNLLAHVEGTKTVHIGTFEDPATHQREVERGFVHHAENAHVLPPDVSTYELGPGDGLYIPPYTFHWVTGTAGASVSLSLVFHTAASDRAEAVHRVNGKLRARGLRPRPPGRSVLRDRAKARAFALRRRASRTRATA